MRKPIIVVVIIAFVLFVPSVLFVQMLNRGFSTHDQPTTLETTIAQTMRHWATPTDLRDIKNPAPLTPQVLAEARAHFADHCATCHGNDGKGNTEMGRHLYPRTPDLTLAKTQSLSDGELFATIENGVRLSGMPGFGNGTAESGYASWTLVYFIRHLPKITTEELAEMEKLNPKSPEEWREMQSEESFLKGAP